MVERKRKARKVEPIAHDIVVIEDTEEEQVVETKAIPKKKETDIDLIWDAISRIQQAIDKLANGHVSTVTQEGQPRIVPKVNIMANMTVKKHIAKQDRPNKVLQVPNNLVNTANLLPQDGTQIIAAPLIDVPSVGEDI